MATKYPNLDKMIAVSKESNAQGQFLRWLIDEKHYHLAKYEASPNGKQRLYPEFIGDLGTNRLLAEYHGIDYDEMERQRILDDIRGRTPTPKYLGAYCPWPMQVGKDGRPRHEPMLDLP